MFLYTNPFDDILYSAYLVIIRFPLAVLSLLFKVPTDSILSMLRLEWHLYLSLLSSIVLLVALWPIRQSIKEQLHGWQLPVALCFLLPICLTIPGPRILILAAIWIPFIIASNLDKSWSNFALFLNLPVAFAFSVATSLTVFSVSHPIDIEDPFAIHESNGGTSIVISGNDNTGGLFSLWDAFQQGTITKRYLLSPIASSLTVKRVNDRQMILDFPNGMREFPIAAATIDERRSWPLQQNIDRGLYTVEILSLTTYGDPNSIKVTTDESLDSAKYIWLVQGFPDLQQYTEITLPPVGQEKQIRP